MTDLSSAMAMSASGLKVQAKRIQILAENVSNVDTPGYRRKITTFETKDNVVNSHSGVELGRTFLDRSPLRVVNDPSHPLADSSGNYEGSNVNLLIEIADTREAHRSYEANLKVFDQSRQMSSSLNELLRNR